MENDPKSQFRFTQWLNESLTLKLAVIFILTLLLLIPAALVNDLVIERQYRQQEVVQEVSQSWSGSQTISGPLLMVPVLKQVKIIRNGMEQFETVEQYLYLLPEQVSIDAETSGQELSRGIFKVAVYEGVVKINGLFSSFNLEKEGLSMDQINWDKLRLLVGVSDLRGVKSIEEVRIGNQTLQLDEFASERVFNQNLVFSPELNGAFTSLPFELTMEIRGTESLNFLPLAKETKVHATGNWGSPKFVGQYLPDERAIASNQYDVSWNINHFARTIPQQWLGDQVLITGKESWNVDAPYPVKDAAIANPQNTVVKEVDGIGLEFLQPINHYQKNVRATKYAILVIALSFLALFFTEIIAKKKIHVVQYVLIGLALVVFYSLLLAFTEHIGFNLAYVLAAAATIGLITLFIFKLLGQRNAAGLFAGLLVLFYSFVFVIIQVNDYALLLGSIGLFLCIGALMYFSSKINWQGQ
jgi:inner membrane protein